MEGTKHHKARVLREDFWFRNRHSCRNFCVANNFDPQHWKRMTEARTFRFRELENQDMEHHQEWKCKCDSHNNEDDGNICKCNNNAESHVRKGDPMRCLVRFEDSGWWHDNGSDNECLSTDSEEEDKK